MRRDGASGLQGPTGGVFVGYTASDRPVTLKAFGFGIGSHV